MSEKKEKIGKLIDESTERLGVMADVNTVVGKAITTKSGFQIIPFSKVTLGNLVGGGEYGNAKNKWSDDKFAGGSGAALSMKPMGFLVDDGKGCYILRVTDAPIDNLIERAGEIVRDVMSKE